MRYTRILGVGGIGSGIFFKLSDNHTIGREESRMAELTDFKDYCKLHIIASYPGRLLKGKADVFAIGKIGRDGTGAALLRSMKGMGIHTEFVTTALGVPTMVSVCFQYPDGNGGNLTASNSACNLVDAAYIDSALEKLSPGKDCIFLAAPEIPVASRIHFLKRGRECGAFTAASCLAGEANAFATGFAYCMLLSVNVCEAAAIAGVEAQYESRIADACYEKLFKANPGIKLIVTLGAEGCIAYENGRKKAFPAVKTQVASTAGAGDAMLGGVLSALSAGHPFMDDENGKICAVTVGAHCAAAAVGSADTIPHILSKSLLKMI
ncbi:MAG: PfkB family carbohydrate kinase [Spirochaetaceae bacterium]|jgi:sugar/nucleoside kinase (ribokinase family)|nr:PfkB family carbohydrate kinase [Spirochaetaceae bacterium]